MCHSELSLDEQNGRLGIYANGWHGVNKKKPQRRGRVADSLCQLYQ